GLRDDPAWMAKRFWHALSPSEVDQALKLLEEARLVRREDGNPPAPVYGVAETPSTVHSSAVRNFHREMLRLAGEGLDALPVEDRSVTSLTVKMSKKKYAEVCEKLGQWQDEILSLLREDDLETHGGEVYSLVFSATPLTRTKKT
ncbi:MAG: DUF4423 domain-containing protein, partial [Bdellovibrionota bacterium]